MQKYPELCLLHNIETFLVKTLDTQRLYEYICNGNKISRMFFWNIFLTLYTQPFIDLRKWEITHKRKYFYFSWNFREKVFLIFDLIEKKFFNKTGNYLHWEYLKDPIDCCFYIWIQWKILYLIKIQASNLSSQS